MRTLIYVPIIHTSADLGSLAKEVSERGIADLGENLWEKHRKTVEGFWDAISNYFDSIDVSNVKIYQDGMVAEAEIGQEIVKEGVKSGSRNYQLVSKLIERGAVLVKTEDFNLVKEERDKLLALLKSKSIIKKLAAFIEYRLIKNRLLKRRDKFITKRIDETLQHGEKAILFIGAYHNIKKRLPRNMHVTEIKDVGAVREYHRLLPFYKQNKKRFEELDRYLISNVEI